MPEINYIAFNHFHIGQFFSLVLQVSCCSFSYKSTFFNRKLSERQILLKDFTFPLSFIEVLFSLCDTINSLLKSIMLCLSSSTTIMLLQDLHFAKASDTSHGALCRTPSDTSLWCLCSGGLSAAEAS